MSAIDPSREASRLRRCNEVLRFALAERISMKEARARVQQARAAERAQRLAALRAAPAEAPSAPSPWYQQGQYK